MVEEHVKGFGLSLKYDIVATTLPQTTERDEYKLLKSDFSLFKSTGKRTDKLQKLFDALLIVRPISADVERVFSVAGFYCTK
jgi:hypothetical protein